jgi:hypothetical protein
MSKETNKRAERCELCKWWDIKKFGIEIGHDDRDTDKDDKPLEWQGFCCRFPPQFIGSRMGSEESVAGWQYPITYTDCYCGEFAAKTDV